MAERWEYKTLLLGAAQGGTDLGVNLDSGQSAGGEALYVRLNSLATQGWEVQEVIPGAGSGTLIFPTLLLRRLTSTGDKAGL
jgi:hypothetical protein